jgi:hypothetical protein
MRRIVGTIMVLGGILIAPPLWDEIAGRGVRPRIVFAGALASIVTGLVISRKEKTRQSRGGGSRISR